MGNKDHHKSSDGFEFSRIPPLTAELAALKCLKNQRITLLAPTSFLIGSPSFLQESRTTMNARVSSNFDQFGLLTAELAALACLEKAV